MTQSSEKTFGTMFTRSFYFPGIAILTLVFTLLGQC